MCDLALRNVIVSEGKKHKIWHIEEKPYVGKLKNKLQHKRNAIGHKKEMPTTVMLASNSRFAICYAATIVMTSEIYLV